MPFVHLLNFFTAVIIGLIHPVSAAQTYNPQPKQVLAVHVVGQPQGIAPTTNPTVTSSPPNTRKLSITRFLIDCIGPDGKHLRVTQQACDDFNSAWKHITISPTIAGLYGQATKIADHTYQLQVQPDATMATTQELFQALNAYRQKNGIAPLSWNTTLATYAQSRADFFVSKGALDGHAGFTDFINNQDGFAKLGFNHLGENAAYAGPLNGLHLIAGVFASDTEHNSNQLNSDWTNGGIGVSGIATDIIFGSSPR